MSPRSLVIASVLLLAVGLGVWATLRPPPPSRPVSTRPPPAETGPRLGSHRPARPDGRGNAQGTTAGEGLETQERFVSVLVRRPDGKPVSGATVSTSRIALPTRRPSHGETPEAATTDASGHAQLACTELPAVCVARKGNEIGIGLPTWVGAPVSITLGPAASADIEVVGSSGRAVPDATVSALVTCHSHISSFGPEALRTRDGGIAAHSVIAAWSTRTDASGCARFTGLPPAGWEPPDDILGRWCGRLVLVEAEGFRSAHTALADGLNRIVLTPAVEYRARVVDAYGRAIPKPAWASGSDARGWGDQEGGVVALVPDAAPDAEPPSLVLDANGYLPRTLELTARAPAIVDLGTVVLDSAVLLRGSVSHADGTPAGGVLVTADHESAYRVFVQGLTARDGSFALEPPSAGAYRIDAGMPGPPQRGSTRNSCWEAVAEHVRPGEECRLVLGFVPGLLVRLVPPDPNPPGFSLDNVSIVPRSADGRGEYDWLPEDGGRYLVHLYGRGPWNVAVRHRQIQPVDFHVRDAVRGPTDDVLTREVVLRAVSR